MLVLSSECPEAIQKAIDKQYSVCMLKRAQLNAKILQQRQQSNTVRVQPDSPQNTHHIHTDEHT